MRQNQSTVILTKEWVETWLAECEHNGSHKWAELCRHWLATINQQQALRSLIEAWRNEARDLRHFQEDGPTRDQILRAEELEAHADELEAVLNRFQTGD